MLVLNASSAPVPNVEPGFYDCPERFPLEAIKLSPVPKGWVGIAPTAPGVLRLKSIDMILGEPREPGGTLIGQYRKVRDGYQMSFGLTTTEPEQKWLACRYGDLALAKRLPDEMKSCVVRYTQQREYPGSYDMKVTCSTSELEPPPLEPPKARRKH